MAPQIMVNSNNFTGDTIDDSWLAKYVQHLNSRPENQIINKHFDIGPEITQALTNSRQVCVNCSPNPYTALSKALPDGKLQVQQWDSLQDERDKKRDHKSPLGHITG